LQHDLAKEDVGEEGEGEDEKEVELEEGEDEVPLNVATYY
jgi:hypothetical protein